MHKRKVITGAKVIVKNKILENKGLVFTETIEDIIDETEIHKIEAEILEFQGYISPGFIDIHIHGASGCDVMDATMDSLKKISKTVVTSGTTSFLATTMTMKQDVIEASLKNARDFMEHQKTTENECLGAEVLGVHLEGPFINPEFKGAQSEAFIQKPNLTWLEGYLDIIKMITYAPEMDESLRFARALKDKDIILAIGHSGCEFEKALIAFDEGVNHVTHCFNGLAALHHRHPGVIGAALTKPFTLDIITDGIHIHPGFLDTFVRLKSVDKTILITDSMRANFLDNGVYEFGGQKVKVENGECRLENGALAGSVLSMDQALRNMLKHTEFSLEQVIQMLSENPAKKLGIDSRKGSIAIGKDADLVLLNEAFSIDQVFIKGKKVFKKTR